MRPSILPFLSAVLLLLVACAGPGRRGSDQYAVADKPNDFDRAGFGASGLPLWVGLTEPEKRALGNRDLAAAGDPSALLDLAIFAAGSHRDQAGYDSIRHRVQAFVTNHRRAVDAEKSHAGKGRILFKEMYFGFFPSASGKDWSGNPSQAGYDFDESAFTAIFVRQKFNCVSSSLLYMVLARYFGLEVQGVVLTSHVFVQIKTPEGKLIEVETTTPDGYDLVHDEAFYKKKGSSWFASRGLPTTTFAAYQARIFRTPLETVVDNMRNQHAEVSRMPQLDRSRLFEAGGWLDPRNLDAQLNRFAFYNGEYRWLSENKGHASLAAMYAIICPQLSSIRANFPGNAEMQNRVAATWYENAQTLYELGRGPEAVPFIDSAVACVRPESEQGNIIRSNSLGTLLNTFNQMAEAEKFSEAEALLVSRRGLFAGDTNYAASLSWLYQRWALTHWNAGEWSQAMANFEKQKSMGVTADAASLQGNMVNAYLNWASDAREQGDSKTAVQVLEQCKQRMKAPKCDEFLQRMAGEP